MGDESESCHSTCSDAPFVYGLENGKDSCDEAETREERLDSDMRGMEGGRVRFEATSTEFALPRVAAMCAMPAARMSDGMSDLQRQD